MTLDVHLSPRSRFGTPRGNNFPTHPFFLGPSVGPSLQYLPPPSPLGALSTQCLRFPSSGSFPPYWVRSVRSSTFHVYPGATTHECEYLESGTRSETRFETRRSVSGDLQTGYCQDTMSTPGSSPSTGSRPPTTFRTTSVDSDTVSMVDPGSKENLLVEGKRSRSSVSRD